MLRKHEIDLIAGLAEGSLEDESEARALVDRSEEARAEYEAQKVAYEALRGAEPVSMSESEKAALHRDLWTTLQQTPQATAQKAPWYLRLAPVAAALFVIVGLGAVLTQGVLTQESGDEAATVETFANASEGLSVESTAEGGERSDAADTTEGMGADADDGAADLADEEAAQMAPALATAFGEIADAIRTQGDIGDATATLRSLEAGEELEEAAECLESAGIPNHSILGEFEDPSGSEATYLAVVQSNEDIGPDTRVLFVDTGACEIAHVEG